MDALEWRRDARARLIDTRQSMSVDEHQLASAAIENFLEEVLQRFPPQTVSAYWPVRGEVDLRDLMGRLRFQGWITALPSVAGPGKPLQFLRWTFETEMEQGVFGIPVPRVRDAIRPDIVIAPLIAFDEENHRLGYGAGYYDITLASLKPRPHCIGVGFELGRLATIHPLPTDIPMDFIITEAGIQRLPLG